MIVYTILCVLFIGASMRVIAGKARSLSLKTLPSDDTRPTTDKIKETLFNILHYDIPDCTFLDLFSGSGAIGIEALSRGAESCIFIEQNPKAIQCINENLRFTKLAGSARVIRSDVLSILSMDSINNIQSFDFIFMDPPYDRLLEEKALRLLSDKSYVTRDTVIIVEASAKTDFSYLNDLGFEIFKTKNYKTNQHVFIRRI